VDFRWGASGFLRGGIGGTGMKKIIFAKQGLQSSTHTFSSPLVYFMAKSKAHAKQFDWMQAVRCTMPIAMHVRGNHKQVTVFITMKTSFLLLRARITATW